MTTSRLLAPILALVGIGLTLGGCTTTSYTCSGGTCTVTLSGAGASAEVESAGYTAALQEADGTSASFSLNGESATCTEGENLQVGAFDVTCTEVEGDRVVLEIR